MRSINKDPYIATVIASILTFAIFWQFFLNGLHPFPGNYLLAWYQPWKTDHTKGQTITIQHKPVADDTFRYLYPLKQLGIDMAKKGEFPLWNPYNGAGMPLLATYQAGLLNPFNIFFFLLRQETAWSLYIVAQAFVLSFFMFLYCTKLYTSKKSAAFATVIFVLSGFATVRLIFGNLIYPLIALPLVLYLIETYIENQKSKKIYFLPLTIATMMLSGHPHMMAYVIAVIVSYSLYRILITQKSINKRIACLLFLTLLFSVGIGLASIQLLPTIELLKNANMTTTSSAYIFERFLLPPSHLISILIPNYFGNQATYNYWGSGDYIETIAAVGIIPIFFAYFSFFGKISIQKNHILFFSGILIISILLTLNWFVPKLFYTLPIPIISTSPPSRIFILTTFSVAILAGYGFDRWILQVTNTKRLIIQTIPFIIIICAVIITTYALHSLGISCDNEFIKNCRLIAARNTFLEGSVFVFALSLFLLYIKINNQKIKKLLPFMIIILCLLLGIYNSYKFLPVSQKETILPIHPLFENLQDKTTMKRAFGFGEANIKTNFATFFRFYDPNYYDPLHNRRYSELIGFANNGSLTDTLSRSDIEITNDLSLSIEKHFRRERLLNLLGVSYRIFKKSDNPPDKNNAIVWQNESWYIQSNNTLPRAYLINQVETISQKERILTKLFDASFNPQTTAIIEKPLLSSIDKNTKGRLEIKRYEENSLDLHVKSEGTQLLVLSDNYYPGWKAYIDGKETEIHRTNYTFRGIVVPKGDHTVTFIYFPNSFIYGTILSIASLILYTFILFLDPIKNIYHTHTR